MCLHGHVWCDHSDVYHSTPLRGKGWLRIFSPATFTIVHAAVTAAIYVAGSSPLLLGLGSLTEATYFHLAQWANPLVQPLTFWVEVHDLSFL